MAWGLGLSLAGGRGGLQSLFVALLVDFFSVGGGGWGGGGGKTDMDWFQLTTKVSGSKSSIILAAVAGVAVVAVPVVGVAEVVAVAVVAARVIAV